MKLSKKIGLGIFAIPIQYTFVQLLAREPALVEKYYSTGFYPFISKTLRLFLGWIPFSFGDLLGFVILFYFLKSIYLLIKSRFTNWIQKTVNLILFLSSLYFCFYLFWGFNYFRNPLSHKLGLKHSNYTTEDLLKTTDTIVSLLNNSHFTITKNDTSKVNIPYTINQIHDIAPDGFNKLSIIHPEFAYHFPSIKNSAVSSFQSYNGTSGYINPITGEAQINSLIPKTGYPATVCHEMAHQIGWAAENEANFISFLSSIYNDDIYFRYAGYRMAYQYCIRELYRRDKALAKNIKKKVNIGIYKDYKDSNLFWKSYENPIEPIMKRGYNSYLKANNQTKGIRSYSYVVDLLIAYYKKSYTKQLTIKNQ